MVQLYLYQETIRSLNIHFKLSMQGPNACFLGFKVNLFYAFHILRLVPD